MTTRINRNWAIIEELQDFKKKVKTSGISDELRMLELPSVFESVKAIALDWFLILFSVVLVTISPVLLPIAMFITGNRQRAIGNLLHDSSHVTLFPKRKQNDLISNLLLAYPLFTAVKTYRAIHLEHHFNLGDSKLDPDYIDNIQNDMSSLNIFLTNAAALRTLKSSLFGHLFSVSIHSVVAIIFWWIIVCVSMAVLVSVKFLLVFLAVWFASKLTVFHLITIFRELSDHAGLQPGTIVSFTRNSPHKGLLKEVFHPHNNGYHLVHHLDYRIPFFQLSRAHKLLWSIEEYRTANHCKTYFGGSQSVVESWKLGGPVVVEDW